MTPAEAAAILQVGSGASVSDVDRAFQRRARQSHPDRFAGAADADIRAATADFVRLIEARDVMRAAAPRKVPRSEPSSDPLAGHSGEPLSFEQFVRIRDARAWLMPHQRGTVWPGGAGGSDPDAHEAARQGARVDGAGVSGLRGAHHEWVVLPVVFSVLAVAIWGLTILLPG